MTNTAANIAVTAKRVKDVPQVINGKKYLVSGWVLVVADGRAYSADGVSPHVFSSRRIADVAGQAGLIAEGLQLVAL